MSPRVTPSDDRGAVAVIIAIAIVALVGFTAMVVDIGSLYEDRRQLQTAADSAALAGVQELPRDTGAAQSAASSYCDGNYARPVTKGIEIGSTYIANDTIRVSLTDPAAPLFLAGIFGHETSAVHAKATAVACSPNAYEGVMPFGIMSADPSETAPFGYTFGDYIEMKSCPKSTDGAGNFQFVALTEDSAHAGGSFIYDALAAGGVPNPVYVGRDYYTKTGINGSRVFTDLSAWITCEHTLAEVAREEDGLVHITDPPGEPDGCHRIIVVPIVINPEYPEGDPLRYNWTEVAGSKLVTVIGFANFFVSDWGSSGMDCYLRGYFIRPVEPDALSYGALNPWSAVHYMMTD